MFVSNKIWNATGTCSPFSSFSVSPPGPPSLRLLHTFVLGSNALLMVALSILYVFFIHSRMLRLVSGIIFCISHSQNLINTCTLSVYEDVISIAIDGLEVSESKIGCAFLVGPVVGEPVVRLCVVGDLVVGESVVGEPVVGLSLVGESVVGRSVVGDCEGLALEKSVDESPANGHSIVKPS